VVSIASYKVIFVLGIFVVDIPFASRISIQEVAPHVLVIPHYHHKLLSQYTTCIINDDRRMTK